MDAQKQMHAYAPNVANFYAQLRSVLGKGKSSDGGWALRTVKARLRDELRDKAQGIERDAYAGAWWKFGRELLREQVAQWERSSSKDDKVCTPYE